MREQMELDITIECDGSVCKILLTGEVDVYSAPVLKERLLEQMQNGCVDLILDLNGVSFIDSSGLGVLVGTLRRVRENSGTLRIVCGRDNVLKVFSITGLDKVFPVFDSFEEASNF